MDGKAGTAAAPAPDAVRCEVAVVGGGLVGAAIAAAWRVAASKR